MEIPYTVTARPDTGLWNAKIGIWLFLASEVMLFGGLFSSYIFLRVGADYPWPVGVQKVPLGFTNTLVLILSSVTVVFAWASLKMRNYRNYQIYMSITIACAFGFMVIKFFEYKGKLTHWSLRMDDGSVLTGHVHHTDDDNVLFTEVNKFKLNTAKSDPSYFLDFISGEDAGTVTFSTEAGEAVNLTKNWVRAQERAGETAVVVVPSKPLKLSMSRRIPTTYSGEKDGAEGSVLFRDGTMAYGHLESDSITMEVDALDLQAVNLKKVEGGDIANARVFHYLGDAVREEFIEHRDAVHEEVLAHRGKEFPVDKDIDVRRKALQLGLLDLADKISPPHAGEDKHSEGGGEKPEGAEGHGHGTVTIPNEDVRFYSNFSPRLNTYYAIYFLLTGLHGLHVLGGIVVLGYFLVRGRKLYNKNPEHLANRVEVGGLFWHFVDLVWIFLFPILYLM